MDEQKKLLVVITWELDDERPSVGWSIANAGIASDFEVTVFLAASGALLLGRHIDAHRVFARSRRRIPLVVGGWGTRGKSGTERIKAALCNAQGHRLVAKTTGCEAMFLYSDTFGELHELMLFRPYDRATIWEKDRRRQSRGPSGEQSVPVGMHGADAS